ncbi:MAG TPA: SDR family NAD(P)-dependent oxidoreductase [Novosphingobium sp.]|nr:SDR family NAD(P)-dependent oxidoreductase [Novosphingobium sp.]
MTVSPSATALITGASTGIGAVYAERLARRGHDLILVARDAARLAALAERLTAETGRKVDVRPADLTVAAQLARLADVIAHAPGLGLLVNNAGIALPGTLTTSTAAEVERLIALNVTAPALLARAAGQRFAAQGHGAIVNIASVLALTPEMFDGTYSATKAFILNLSQGLARELGESGVQVQAVLPGATRTEIWERSGKDVNAFPPEMVMDAGDLVDAALVGLDRGETVTIPPLADEAGWDALNAARLALAPLLSRRDVARRYRETA